nr:cell envelope integrity protein TolA [Oceanococcus sp. HetDA_MAG_MS8]
MQRTSQRGFQRADLGPLLLSIGLHLALAALLVFGLPQLTRPLPPPGPKIVGTVVESPTARALEEKRRKEAERRAREEAERKAKAEAERKAREEAERKAKAEAERKAQEEAERKAKAEAERKAREEAERKAQAEAERKAREEAERKAKAEAERKAREEAERKAKAEAERKAREEAERKAKAEAERKAREKAQQAREDALEAAMREEEQRIQQAQDAQDANRWAEQIADEILREWVRPSGAPADFSCEVRVELSLYGDVLQREIIRSCGNEFLDNSVLQAVDQASPLPLPRNSRVFQTTINITFEPL